MNVTLSPGLRSQLLQYALNPLVKTVIEGVETKDPQSTKPPEPSHGGGVVPSFKVSSVIKEISNYEITDIEECSTVEGTVAAFKEIMSLLPDPEDSKINIEHHNQ